MTDNPHSPPPLARFLQDWAALWREELQAQAGDSAGGMAHGVTPEVMEIGRAAMALWAAGVSREPAATPRAEAAAAASEPRDDAVERLTRRVDELEARLAKLEPGRRRRG